MNLQKQCELCLNIYSPRKDKIYISRFCSKKCQHKGMGLENSKRRKEFLATLSEEEIKQDMKRRFEEFFKKDSVDKCWYWVCKKGKNSSDYGNFKFMQKDYKSNRASWIIYRGEIPTGMYVLHTCDVRNCVNPDHLFLGTHADNMHDMKAKGRAKPRFKLTEEQVKEIKRLLALGVTTVRLAKDYNVSSTCIWYIKHNKLLREALRPDSGQKSE